MVSSSTFPFASWLKWEHNDARMPLVLIVWTMVVFNRRFFLYTAPPWIIATWVSQTKDTDVQRFIDRRLSTLLAGWLAWMTALCTLGTAMTIWLLGCGLLTWKSPWANLARTYYYQTAKKAGRYPVTKGAPMEERLYQFVVIEHQRWLGGWTDRLLLDERPAWSDEYLQPVPPTDEFTLPPPSKSGYWGWADGCWRLDGQGVTTDQNGWEYTSWDWSPLVATWSPFRFTRRRRWVRCAQWEDASEDMWQTTQSIRRTASRNSSASTTTTTTTSSTASTMNSSSSSRSSLLSAITAFSNSSACASVKTASTTAITTGPIEMTRIRP